MGSWGGKAAEERKQEGNNGVYDFEFQYILEAHSSDWSH